MSRNQWRPGDDEHPMKLLDRMPREDELADLPPGARAVSLLLRSHGVNPWHVAATQDAITPEGWLRPTGRILENDLELERIPWEIPADDVAEIVAAFWKIDWTPQKPPPPPDPLDALRKLAAMGVQLGPPTVSEDAYRAAVRYWRTRLRSWQWLTLAAASGGFLLGWTLRALLGLP